MKKRIFAVFCAAACLLSAACGQAAVGDVESANAAEAAGSVSEKEMEIVQSEEILPFAGTETQTEEEGNISFTEEAEEGPVKDGVYEGIVMDAAMNSFSIYTDEKRTLYFEMPEEGDHLKEGMLLGIPVRVVCKGGLVTELTDGQNQPAASREALEFAGSIMTAFRYKDRDILAALTGFPVSVSLDGEAVTVKDAEEFAALSQNKLFSKERCQAVLTVDLYGMKELDGGTYVLGNESGKPNVIFSVDEGNDRGFSVTGIN